MSTGAAPSSGAVTPEAVISRREKRRHSGAEHAMSMCERAGCLGLWSKHFHWLVKWNGTCSESIFVSSRVSFAAIKLKEWQRIRILNSCVRACCDVGQEVVRALCGMRLWVTCSGMFPERD